MVLAELLNIPSKKICKWICSPFGVNILPGSVFIGHRPTCSHMLSRAKLSMPEGPEIKITSLYINTVCKGLSFNGNPVRSDVSKNPPVVFDRSQYTIRSESRGKELSLVLTCKQNTNITQRLLFRFGMSGRFTLASSDNIPKHTHLSFYSTSAKDLKGKLHNVYTCTTSPDRGH